MWNLLSTGRWLAGFRDEFFFVEWTYICVVKNTRISCGLMNVYFLAEWTEMRRFKECNFFGIMDVYLLVEGTEIPWSTCLFFIYRRNLNIWSQWRRFVGLQDENIYNLRDIFFLSKGCIYLRSNGWIFVNLRYVDFLFYGM